MVIQTDTLKLNMMFRFEKKNEKRRASENSLEKKYQKKKEKNSKTECKNTLKGGEKALFQVYISTRVRRIANAPGNASPRGQNFWPNMDI